MVSPPILSRSASASTNASAASATTAAAGTAHESVRSFCASNGCLVARSTDELVGRLGNAETRPLLVGKDVGAEIEKLLAQRRPYYARAHLAVDTTGLAPSQVARQIQEALESS